FQGSLEHEVHAWAADVAVVAQDRGAPSRVVFRQAYLLANSGQDFAASGVENPSVDVSAGHPGAAQPFGEYLVDVLRGQRWNGGCQDVAQHAATPLEPNFFA